MRRETSTVVVLAGEPDDGMLAELARSPNVTIARAPAPEPPAAGQPAAARAGWEPGALAMREAARRRSTYVIVPDDPLAEVAAGWHAMWDISGGGQVAPVTGSANGGQHRSLTFETGAAEALAAWLDKRFDLPDYYLVIAPAETDGAGADLYLGPLRAVRPRRVAIAGAVGAPAQAAQILAALRSLEHGPWWPPLDEVLDAARRFYPGGLAETQIAPP